MLKKLLLSFTISIFLFAFAKAQEEAIPKEIKLQSDLIEAFKLEQIGKTDKAIELLEKLSIEAEVRSAAKYQLARLYEKIGKNELAVESINQSIVADPNNKWNYIMKINLLEKYGHNEEIANCYSTLSKLEPDNYIFYDNAAIYYLKANLLEKTMSTLENAEKKFGLSPKIALKKSNIFVLQKKEKKAIETLETTIKEYPYHSEIYPELIILCGRNGLDQKVKQYSDNLTKLDSDHPFLRSKASMESSVPNQSEPIQVMIEKEEYSIDSKIKLLIPLVQKYSTSPEPQLLTELKQFGQSILKQYPDDSKSHALIADIYFQSNEMNKAKEHYETAIQKGNVPYPVYENVIIASKEIEAWLSAEKYANKALDIFPNQSFLFYALAEALYNQGKYEEAYNNINQALLILRNNSAKKMDAKLLLAKICDASKKTEEAQKAWTEVANNTTSDISIIEFQLNEIKQGKKENSSLLEKSLNSNTLDKSKQIYYKAELAQLKNESEKSNELLNQYITSTNIKKPSVYALMAKNYLKLGNKIEAKKNIELAIALSENKAMLKKWLSEIN